MTETKEKGSYTYFTNEGMEFTLEIPIFWETIYKGKPRERLYEEYIQMLNIVKKLPKDKIIVDVGVNFGLFSVPVCKLGYFVLGFEPVKINYDSSVINLENNGCKNFKLLNLALSNKTENTVIYVPECPDNASLNKNAAIANMIHKDYTEEIITCVSFDELNKDAETSIHPKDVGLIKLDIQGNELNCLLGMKEFLSQTTGIYIIAEYEEHLLKYGHTYEELDNLFISLGFRQVGKISNDKIWYKN